MSVRLTAERTEPGTDAERWPGPRWFSLFPAFREEGERAFTDGLADGADGADDADREGER
jgi:hypothetical protein